MDITIRPLASDEDAAVFRSLNEEWITRNFALEAEDRRQLEDPVRAYIEPGGEILIAELGGRAVGCVAILPDGTGAWELSKMAVAPELRGRGAGRQLLGATVERASARSALAVPRELEQTAEHGAPIRGAGLSPCPAGGVAHAVRAGRCVHATGVGARAACGPGARVACRPLDDCLF